jgi:SAM-dependent methyltransferase
MGAAIREANAAPDFAPVKAKQQAAWATGDYAVIGTTLQVVGENLAEAMDLRAGRSVLDVAAGNGNATLAAARRGCVVQSTDYVPALLERAHARARAEGLVVRFEPADAEQLPYPDRAFDAVMSTFGVMFTPNQEQAAREMARVCKPGGKIGLANWTPASFIGRLFKVIGAYLPPAPGMRSPALWGTEARLQELFGERIAEMQCRPKHFAFRYRSAEDWLDTFRKYYGPVHKAFLALDPARQAQMREEMLALAREMDAGGGDGLVVPSEYLEVVIRVR